MKGQFENEIVSEIEIVNKQKNCINLLDYSSESIVSSIALIKS